MFKGITSNGLKIIAIVTMIIDHIGYYFFFIFDDKTYITCRIIGRIAMPIFTFLIVQGYFNTKNFKKYVLRLLALAIITQICINITGYINSTYVSGYSVNIVNELNIVFSFVISLCTMYIIDNDIIEKKSNISKSINIVLKILIVLIFGVLIYYIPIDYGYTVPILAISIYIFEKAIKKDDQNLAVFFRSLICLTIFGIGLSKGSLNIFMFLSIPFIMLYNCRLGKKSKIVRNFFYYIFPVQHIILYIIALGVYSKMIMK